MDNVGWVPLKAGESLVGDDRIDATEVAGVVGGRSVEGGAVGVVSSSMCITFFFLGGGAGT